jgi:hypothetical protein
MRVPRRALVFALTLVHAALAGAAQEIYRTVDAQGRVTYSDRPTDGAESVKVGPANTMSQPAPTVAPPRPESAEGAPRPYNLIAITEPADGATVTDQLGDFTVRYRTEPVRQADHAVRLVLDGQPAGTNVADGVRVSGAARGEHRLMIQVLDRNGRLLGQSASVRILVVRPGPGHRPRAPG